MCSCAQRHYVPVIFIIINEINSNPNQKRRPDFALKPYQPVDYKCCARIQNFLRLMIERGFNTKKNFLIQKLRPIFKSGPYSRASIIGASTVYKHGPIIPLRGYGWTQNFQRVLLIALDVFVAVDSVVGFIVEDFFGC